LPETKKERERTRAFWSGTLTFGLVSIPVELYAGNRPSRVRMHMLDEDGTPLRRRYVCPAEGVELDADDIVRGYEIEKDHYVVVTDEELEALEPTKSRDIDLRRFVPQDDIDPVFFERAYFLAPGGGSTKAYRLLADTMEESRMAGIATFVMRTKEYLVAILAENGVLRAETLRFADEIRTPDDVGLPEPPKRQSKKTADAIGKQIAKLAKKELDEAELEDGQAERVLALVAEKVAEHEDVVRAKAPPEDDDEDVIDLMALLKKRLQAGGTAKKSSGGTAKKRGGGTAKKAGTTKKATAKKAGTTKKAAAQARKRAGSARSEDDDLAEQSKEQLYERARKLDIAGRSGMSKPQLIRAIRKSA
jgi:DNA end-binding protein Ku